MAVTQGLSRDLRRLFLPAPLHVDNRHLLAGGAAETVTVPLGAAFCVFSPLPKSADFLVRFEPTAGASLPTADVTNGQASFPNPTSLAVTPGGTFTIIPTAGTAVDVAMAFYGKDEISW